MIIGSYYPLEIGQVVNDGFVWDVDLVKQKVAFKVIKEASFEDYERQIKEYNPKIENIGAARGAFYYEVWID